ncbi:diguanylate cyclase (GGDEF) domain-containing protein [Selenomonas sp. GACV-9]|uniref:GGDEF domain-containing protein n=1 Tax=Selenomonas sp. GACV-9 TaxID=3158782 RepID=UPI0008F35E81|nr:diguanylate cyclase (GGDEF) domain-containing protein [Selenomonas ruminantium]
MLMLVACLLCFMMPQARAEELTGQWYWQQDPVSAGAETSEDVIQRALAGMGDWQPYDAPAQPPFEREEKYIWLMTTLPQGEEIRDASLLMTVTDQSFEVWLDGKRIYSYGDMEPRLMSYGQKWHLIPLPADYAGRHLFIRAYSANPLCLGNFEPIKLDASVVQMSTLLQQDISYIANIPLAVFMILIMLMYYMSPNAPKTLYMQLILFMLAFVVWMVSVSNTKQLFLDAPVFWWGLQRIDVYFFPILANLIIYRVVDREYRRSTWMAMLSFVVLLLIAILSEVFGLSGLDGCASAFYIMLPAIEGMVAYWTLQSAWRGNKYCRALLVPLLGLVAAGTLDGFSRHFHWLTAKGYWLPYGTITIGIFVLYIVQQQIRRERLLLARAAGLEEAVAEAVARSEIDTLTQCYNRNRMQAVLEAEISQHRQEKEPFSLIMLDIDFFKHINDTYGHDAGDEVLATFAGVIRNNIKKSDIFIRWGGEEFILICRGCSGDEAFLVAERLRRQVEWSRIFSQRRITCSVGVASWQGENDSAAQLIKRVDTALYTAKRSGRNTVCREPQLSDEVLVAAHAN